MVFRNNNNKSILDLIKSGQKDFSSVNLSGMNLKNLDLTGCDFTGADLSKAVLRKANLDGAIFKNAFLEGASLVKVSAKKCNFSGAILAKADMLSGDFTEADFSGANMEKAILDSALFNKASFIKTNLNKTILNEVSFVEADLSRCILTNSDGMDGDFSKAIFAGADLNGSVLSYANFKGVDFTEAVLESGEFNFSDFTGVDLSTANVKNSNLKKVYGISEAKESELKEKGALVSGHYTKKILRFLWNNKIARFVSFLLIVVSVLLVYRYFSNPYNRGSLYLLRRAGEFSTSGDHKKALEYYTIIASRRDVYNKFIAYTFMGDVFFEKGEKRKAIDYLEKALYLSEDSLLDASMVVDVEKKIVDYLISLYDVERAVKYIEKRKSFYKGEDFIIEALDIKAADVYFSINEFDKANQIYAGFEKKAESTYHNTNTSNFVIINFKKAVIALESNDKAKADVYFRSYMEDLLKTKNKSLIGSTDFTNVFYPIFNFYMENAEFEEGGPLFEKVYAQMEPDKRADAQFFLLNHYIFSKPDFVEKGLSLFDIDFDLNPRFYYFKGVLARNNNNNELACKFFDKAFKSDQDTVKMTVLFEYVSLLLSENKSDEALDLLKDNLDIKSQYVDVVLMIVNVLKSKGDYPAALKWLKKIKKYSFYKVTYYRELYWINLLQNLPDEAFDAFLKALKYEKSVMALRGLWIDFFNEVSFKGKYDLSFIKENLDDFSDMPDVVFVLLQELVNNFFSGENMDQINKYIVDYFSKYQESDPYYYNILMAKFFMKKGDNEKAFSFYKKVADNFDIDDISFQFHNFFYDFIAVCRKLDKLPECMSLLESLIDKHRHEVNLAFFDNLQTTLFSLCMELKDVQRAKEILAGIKGIENSVHLYAELAQYSFDNGDIEKVFEYYETAIKFSRRQEVYNLLQRLYHMFINYKDSSLFSSFLNKLSEQEETDKELQKYINLVLMDFYMSAGDLDKAVDVFERIDEKLLSSEEKVLLSLFSAKIENKKHNYEEEFSIYSDIIFSKKINDYNFFEIVDLSLKSMTNQSKPFSEKIMFLDKVIELYAGERNYVVSCLEQKINLFREERRYGEAEKICLNILNQYGGGSDKFNMWMHYADLLKNQRKTAEALAVYNQDFPALDENNLSILVSSASNVYDANKDYEGWKDFLDKISEKYSYFSSVKSLVAFNNVRMLLAQGEIMRAYQENNKIKNAEGLGVDAVNIYMILVENLLKIGKNDEAKKLVYKIFEIESGGSSERLFWVCNFLSSLYMQNDIYLAELCSLLDDLLISYENNLPLRKIIYFTFLDIYKDRDASKAKQYISILEDMTLSDSERYEFRFLKALFFEKQGLLDAAVAIYETIINEGNSFYKSRAFEMMVFLCQKGGMEKELEQLLAKYGQGEDKADRFGLLVFLTGVRIDMQHDLPKAEQSIKNFIAQHPNVPTYDLHTELAQIYRMQKSFDDAIALYMKLLAEVKDFNRMPYLINEIINTYVEAANQEKALAFVEEIRVKYPNQIEIQKICFGAAALLHLRDNPQESLELTVKLEDIYKQEGKDIPYSIVLDKMNTYLHMSDYKKAFAIFKEIEDRYREDNAIIIDAFNRILFSLQEKDQKELMQDVLEKGLLRYADNPEISFVLEDRLSAFYLYVGKFDKAKQIKESFSVKYQTMFEDQNKLVDYKNELASLKMQAEEYSDAYKLYKEFMPLLNLSFGSQRLGNVFMNFIKVCFSLELYDEADSFISEKLQEYKGVLELESFLLLGRARLEARKGNYDASIALYKDVLDRYITEPKYYIYSELVEIYKEKGEYVKAFNLYYDMLTSGKQLSDDAIMFAVSNLFNISYECNKFNEVENLALDILSKNKNNISLYQNVLMNFISAKTSQAKFEEISEDLKTKLDLSVLAGKESYDLFSMLASVEMGLRNYSKAREFYAKSMEKYPFKQRKREYADFAFGVAGEVIRSLREEGKYEEFEAYIADLQSKFPQVMKIEFLCLSGKVHFLIQDSKYQEAKNILLDIIKREMYSEFSRIEVYNSLINVNISMGDFSEALKISEELLKVYSKDLMTLEGILNQIVNIYMQKQDYAAATIFIEGKLKEYKDNPTFTLFLKKSLAGIYRAQGQQDKALEVLREINVDALGRKEDMYQVNSEVASVLMQQGKFLEARSIYMQLFDFYQKDKRHAHVSNIVWVVREIINTYKGVKDYAGAFDFIEHVGKIYSDSEGIQQQMLYEKAFVADDSGDIDGALKSFKEIIQLYPEQNETLEVYRRLGMRYREKREYGKSAEFYKQALLLSKNPIEYDVWLLDEIFFAYFENKMYEDALIFRDMLKEKYPNNKIVANKLILVDGQLYCSKQDYDNALKYYNEMLQTAQDNTLKRMLNEKLAFVNDVTGNHKDALLIYKSLIAEDYISSPTKSFYLGEIIRISNFLNQQEELVSFLNEIVADSKSKDLIYMASVETVRLTKVNEPKRALDILNKLLDKYTDSHQVKELYMEFADIYRREASYLLAADYFKKILFYPENSINDVKVNSWMIRDIMLCYEGVSGSTQDQKRSFLDSCLEKYGDILEVQIVIAVEKSKLEKTAGNYELATEYMVDVIEQNKGSVLVIDAMMELGSLFLEQKDYAKASEVNFDLFNILHNNTVSEWMIECAINRYAEEHVPFKERKQFLEKAYSLFSDDKRFEVPVLLALARLSREENDFIESGKVFEKFCLKYPQIAKERDIFYEYAVVMHTGANYSKARELYGKSFEMTQQDETKVNILRSMIGTYREAGDLSGLENFLKEYLSKDYLFLEPVIFYELAMLKKEQSLWEDSEIAIRQAVAMEENRFFVAESYYELADIQRRKNLYRDAAQSYKNYAEFVNREDVFRMVADTLYDMYREALVFYEAKNDAVEMEYYRKLIEEIDLQRKAA